MIRDHMAHFFMIKSGSKFRDQLAHFFIDIHIHVCSNFFSYLSFMQTCFRVYTKLSMFQKLVWNSSNSFFLNIPMLGKFLLYRYTPPYFLLHGDVHEK